MPEPNTASPPSTLIIHNGGYASLIASLLVESEADGVESAGMGRTVVYGWLPPVGSGLFADEPPFVPGSISARNRADMVKQQAQLFGFREVFAHDPAPARHKLSVASLLLHAVEIAADHRCERVIWPIRVGDDLQALHRVTEQAALVTELAALDESLCLDGESGAIRVFTPLADLDADGLDELASDLDAPLEACWRPVASAGGV